MTALARIFKKKETMQEQIQLLERQTYVAYFFSRAHHDVIANDGASVRWNNFIFKHPCAHGGKAQGTKIAFVDTREEIDSELESYRATWPDAVLGGFYPCTTVVLA